MDSPTHFGGNDILLLLLLRIYQKMRSEMVKRTGIQTPMAIARAGCEEVGVVAVRGSEEGRMVGPGAGVEDVDNEGVLEVGAEAELGVGIAVEIKVDIDVGPEEEAVEVRSDAGHDGSPDMLNAADSKKVSPSLVVSWSLNQHIRERFRSITSVATVQLKLAMLVAFTI